MPNGKDIKVKINSKPILHTLCNSNQSASDVGNLDDEDSKAALKLGLTLCEIKGKQPNRPT